MNRILRFPLLLAFLLSCICGLHADVIHLKNGRSIEGKILEETDEHVRVQYKSSKMTISRAEIDRIERKLTPKEEFEHRLAAIPETEHRLRTDMAEEALKKGMHDVAVLLLRKLYKQRPDNPRVARLLREATDQTWKPLLKEFQNAREHKDHEATIALGNELVNSFPELENIAKVFAGSGWAAWQLKDDAAAETFWSRALKKDETEPEAIRGMVFLSIRRNEWGTAVEMAEHLRDHSSGERKQDLETWLTQIGMARAASERIQKDVSDLEAKKELAAYLSAMDGLRLASSYWTEVLAIDPGDASSAVQFALLLFRHGRTVEAILVLERCLDHSEGRENRTLLRDELATARMYARYGDELYAKDVGGVTRLAQLETLVDRYLKAEDMDERNHLLTELGTFDGLTVRQLEAVVRHGSRRAPDAPKGAVFEGTVSNPRWHIDKKYAAFVPTGYTRWNAWPLLVLLHGQNGTGPKYIRFWTEKAEKEGIILVAPTGDDRIGHGQTRPGYAGVFAVIQKMQHTYRIDPDRIYLEGSSMGGHGAWDYIQHFPDRFAGAIPRIGIPKPNLMLTDKNQDPDKADVKFPWLSNIRHVPVFWIVGEKDKLVPVRYARLANRRIKKFNYPVIYNEMKNRGHEFFEERTNAAWAYIGKQVRNRYPETLTFRTNEILFNRCHWLEIRALYGDRTRKTRYLGRQGKVIEEREEAIVFSRVNAKRKGNKIELKIKRIRKMRVFLNSDMVDFTRPVILTVNGTTRFNGILTPSFETLLDTARKNQDRAMTFTAEISIEG